MSERRPDLVVRFDRMERFVHWWHAGLFLALVATGAMLIWSPAARSVALGPYRVLPLVHASIGVLFVLVPLAPAVFGGGGELWRDVKRFFSWRPADLLWFLAAPTSLIVRRLPVPSQGKFNPGQRVNAIFTLLATVILGATGVLIWLGRAVPVRLQESAYEWHVLVALLAFGVFVGHLAMALTHPAALRSIVTGLADRTWAARTHPRWLSEVEAAEKAAPRGKVAEVAD